MAVSNVYQAKRACASNASPSTRLKGVTVAMPMGASGRNPLSNVGACRSPDRQPRMGSVRRLASMTSLPRFPISVQPMKLPVGHESHADQTVIVYHRRFARTTKTTRDLCAIVDDPHNSRASIPHSCVRKGKGKTALTLQRKVVGGSGA